MNETYVDRLSSNNEQAIIAPCPRGPTDTVFSYGCHSFLQTQEQSRTLFQQLPVLWEFLDPQNILFLPLAIGYRPEGRQLGQEI